jgi:hypothetical protein
MDFLGEFSRFMWARKKFWMIPLMLMLVACGALIVLAEGSAVAPFIYTLF